MDEFRSTLVVDGAKCKITRTDDGKFASHVCEWVISKDFTETKSIFRAMVSEMSSCAKSQATPSIHSRDRSEDAIFEDVPNSYIDVRYSFDSGWYLLELEYTVERK